MINPAIKKKIQHIVSVFETSSVEPRYNVLVCLKDGPKINGENIRQITFGAHQTTEYSNLKALIRMYCNAYGKYAVDLTSYLPMIGNPKTPLAANEPFKQLLREAGDDPMMHQVQDEFFDKYYWDPAVNFFSANLFTLNLSMAVIYDSYIHSGGIPSWLRKEFPAVTPLKGGEEKEWITEYVNTRDNWLEHRPNKVLRNTDYRTDCWQEQIKNSNWDLSQPVTVKFNKADQSEWITVVS